jgi:hypothetical protein
MPARRDLKEVGMKLLKRLALAAASLGALVIAGGASWRL